MSPGQQCVTACDVEIKNGLPYSGYKDENQNNSPVTKKASDEEVNPKEFDISVYESMDFKAQIRWPDLIVQVLLHLVSLCGLCLVITNSINDDLALTPRARLGHRQKMQMISK
ncbi:unnamed protein product [Plutella xylostella]|uniref:(diamondback moth) hypothetical protein n=1 Tax=Plutella xylostella TaxID=51655 RepID=A0A8S4EC96_PLUXY|nr:unnamed protein product [Plutella xylostella]